MPRSRKAGRGQPKYFNESTGGRNGVLVFGGRRGFARGADVLRAGILEDFFGRGDFLGIFRVDGKENVARLDFTFVAFGFQFRNAQSDQAAGNAADRRADRRAAESRENRGPQQ